MDNENNESSSCPICCNVYPLKEIEYHVNKCLFLNSKENEASPSTSYKRARSSFEESAPKKTRVEEGGMTVSSTKRNTQNGDHDVSEVICHNFSHGREFIDDTWNFKQHPQFFCDNLDLVTLKMHCPNAILLFLLYLFLLAS